MEILGHDTIRERLFRATEDDRLHHALLFHGPEGVGKRRMAFRLAMYRTCPRRIAGEGDCGGACPSCARMAGHYRQVVEDDGREAYEKQQHPDLFYIEPYLRDEGWIIIGDREKSGEKRKAKGRAYDKYYGSIRWLQAHLRLKPHEAAGTTVIIEQCDRIHFDARHSLLKALEEPSPGSLFILVTSKPEALLDTYRSRCQPVRFSPFARRDLERILVERFHRSPSEARLLASVSGGSLGGALSIDLDAWREKRALALDVVQAAARPGWASRQALMEMAGEISTPPGHWERVGRDVPPILGSLVRDLSLLQCGAGAEMLANPDLGDELGVLAGTLPALEPRAAFELADGVRRGLERNLNRRLVCETMLLRLSELFGHGAAGR